MIDAKDRVFREHVRDGPLQRARRLEVVTERLLDGDACAARETRLRERARDVPEERRRNREVVQRMARVAERVLECRVGLRIAEVAADVTETIRERGNRARGHGKGLLDMRGGPLEDGLRREVPMGDPDDGHPQAPLAEFRERGQQHLGGEVARGAEQHQGIAGRRRGHGRRRVRTDTLISSPLRPIGSRQPGALTSTAARMPARSAAGEGGQPGISTFTGITLLTRPRLA